MGDDNWPSYGTDENKEYRFRDIGGKCLRFKVKTAHDAHVALTSGAEETDPIVEVFIGAWEGAASAIRFKKADDLAKVDTPDILNEEEYREFWITFDNDEVRVGKAGDWEPFMMSPSQSHSKSPTMAIPLAGVLSAGGSFIMRDFHTEDSQAYKFEPVYGDSLTFSVSCGHDAHLALTSGPEETTPMYEVFIGGWENQHSAIRLNKGDDMIKVDSPDIVCSEEERKFWLSFKNGRIRVGYKDSDPFMEWTDPEPWKVTHVGYTTAWGAAGKWMLEI
uniref:Farnesoic acid o-methyltransferase n=1 Tax=Panulirus interruptus TaxID=6735 RepID=Q9NGL4_PANIN|nr:farnesoic acid o-methyltransferase [Panulirus interruptus]